MTSKFQFVILFTLIAFITTFSDQVQSSTPDIIITKISQIDTIGQADDVVIKNGIAFVSDMGKDSNPTGGLYIFNISDPYNPFELSHFYDGGRSHQIELLNDTILIVADNTGGLEIFNIKNLTNPEKIGNFNNANYINGFTIKNSTTILATSFTDGLIVIDISNLTEPMELTRFQLSQIQPISLIRDFAFISGLNNFYILNVSDLSNITIYAQLSYEISTFKFDVANNLTYTACSGSIYSQAQGFKIFNISDLKNIKEIGSFNDGGHPTDIVIMNDYAFVTNYDFGIEILNIENKSNITKIGSYESDGNAFGFEIVDNLIYLANGMAGLQILKIGNSNGITSSQSQSSTVETSTHSQTSSIETSKFTNTKSEPSSTPGFEIMGFLLVLILYSKIKS